MINYPQVDRDSCAKGLLSDHVSDRSYSARMVSSHQHIQFGHCLGWVSWKQLSERLLQSREVGLVRSKLNHLLSLGGDSTLITEGPLPTRMLTTTSSRSLFGFKSL